LSISEEIGETQILAALLGIAEMVGELTDTREMLEAIVRIAPSLVRVDRCAILAYDASAREFRTIVSFGPAGRGTAFDGLRIPEADMPHLAQRLVGLHLPALVTPGSHDAALRPALVKRLRLKAALLVPLVYRGRVLGILWLDHSAHSHYFTSKEINVIQGIAALLAVALDGASRVKVFELERRRFAALAHALSDGVIVLDRDLRIRDLDRPAEELLGWQPSEIRGRQVHEVFGITEAEAGVAWTREAKVPSPVAKFLQMQARDGRQVPCDVLAVPVRDASGNDVQILYVLRVRSEARTLEASITATAR
jgi:PAS domain S-box-containing protein